MKLFLYFIFFSLAAFAACSSSSVKEKIEHAGDVAGQTAGKIAKGIESGIHKSFDVEIEVPEALKKRGISLGKTIVSSDKEGTDNLLSIYVIFTDHFKGPITIKAFDSKSREMGRVTVPVEGNKGEATYIDFHFDKRTNIDNDSKLTMESF